MGKESVESRQQRAMDSNTSPEALEKLAALVPPPRRNLVRYHGVLAPEEVESRIRALQELPRRVEEVLALDAEIRRIAQKFFHSRNFLFLGRGIMYPIALEGALKLKEISYIHAEGYAAGEMVIAIASEGDREIAEKCSEVIYIPDVGEELSAVLATVPLQLLAYHVAVLKGTDIDQPRNLAKSVTVE